MGEPLRFGVIGLGVGMSRARMVKKTEGAELIAVCDLKEDRRRKAAEEFGCEAYEDYHRMLERDDIDVVMVMTPSGLHAKIGIDVADSGKHVIVTKPMDITLEACDALIEACERNGVKLMVDFGERYNPLNRRIKKALEMGAIGDPILIEVRMKWWRSDEYYIGWHGTWELDGGGSLMNQGVHQIDLMQWFMGPVKAVCGHYGVYAHKNCETEDLSAALVLFESGAVGTVLTTTTCPGGKTTMIQIHGTKGVIGKGPEVWEFVGEPPQIEVEPHPRNIVEDAIGVIREGKQPAVDGREGRKSVEIILAIYKSWRERRWVELPLSGP